MFLNQHRRQFKNFVVLFMSSVKLEFKVQELSNNAVIAVVSKLLSLLPVHTKFSFLEHCSLVILQLSVIWIFRFYYASWIKVISSISASDSELLDSLITSRTVGNIIPSENVNHIAINVSFSYPHTNKVLMNNFVLPFCKRKYIRLLPVGNGTGKINISGSSLTESVFLHHQHYNS